jgi:hypothetical protein
MRLDTICALFTDFCPDFRRFHIQKGTKRRHGQVRGLSHEFVRVSRFCAQPSLLGWLAWALRAHMSQRVLRSYLLTCFLEALLTYLLITYLLITYLLGYLLAITLLMSNAGRYHGWIW